MTVAALVAGACGGEGKGSSTDDATPTTIAGDGETAPGETDPEDLEDITGGDAGTASNGTPTTAGGGNGGATTVKPGDAATPGGGAAAEDLGPPGDPGQPVPAADGGYTYKIRRASDGAALKPGSDARLTLRTTARSPHVRQAHELQYGPSSEQTDEYRWEQGAMFWDKLIQKGQACDWTPDVEQLRIPVAKGQAFSGSSFCEFIAGPVKVKRRISGRTDVTDIARLKIGGEVVDVWVLTRKLRMENEYLANGQVKKSLRELNETEWFAPKQGLVVKEHIRQSGTNDKGEKYSDEFERTITSLKPS